MEKLLLIPSILIFNINVFAQSWTAGDYIINGNVRSYSFKPLGSASDDLYLDVEPGTRTFRTRNWNTNAPNILATSFHTGYGIFEGSVTIGGDVSVSSNSLFKGNMSLYGNITLGLNQTETFIKTPAYGGALKLRGDASTWNRYLQLGNTDNYGTFFPTVTVTTNGLVGIGTVQPDQSYKLDVVGGIHSTGVNNFDGTTNFGSDLNINGNLSLSSTTSIRSGMNVWGNITLGLNQTETVIKTPAYVGAIKFRGDASTWNRYLQLGNTDNYGTFYPTITVTTKGIVGIGTDQPNEKYKLDVAGPIRANEVVVNTTGADFVFAPSYKLRTLSEVEHHIKEKGHLPEIAPAAEMEANGVNVSEMQTKLLQKIEELTLYMIELQKQNEQLKKEIEIIKSK